VIEGRINQQTQRLVLKGLSIQVTSIHKKQIAMKKYRILFFALAFVVAGLASCTKNDSQLSFQLDTPFTLNHQEVAVWENNSDITIKFNQITEDSRCPIDVECVWAGRVAVEVSFTQDGSSATDVLILGDGTGSDYTDTATFGKFSVKVLQVKPDPLSNVVIPQSKYEAQLEIKKDQ
jgi:ABC-type glycerol-3-phosphate transport system substrate-binding protein